jgi:CelD/BcsL family acetyltransferase involved in cellulose biosynthesis
MGCGAGVVRITVVRPQELGESELTAWRALQLQTPTLGSPFFAPEYAVAVGRIRPATRVAVLEDGNAPVGFFAFERRSLGYGLPLAPGLTEAQGVVHAPGLEWDPTELLRACGLSFWEFDNLVDGQQPFAAYRVMLAPSPVMDISGGFEPYLAERRRASSRIRDLPRRRRRLEREIGPMRFEFDSQDYGALRTLMAWKSAQYQRTGRRDRFTAPWIVELVEAMMATRAAGCTGRLSVLYAGDQMVAAHFGLSSPSVIPTWWPTYDTRFAPYSPGLHLHLEMARAAAEAGIGAIELGSGYKDYKEWLKTYDVVVGEGRVRRPSATAVLHWARRVPVRRVRNTIVQSPALYHAADRVLVTYARLRDGTGPKVADQAPAAEPAVERA